jgi:hypothetical protein
VIDDVVPVLRGIRERLTPVGDTANSGIKFPSGTSTMWQLNLITANGY